jgi:branched-chain amino acid aminotransferase
MINYVNGEFLADADAKISIFDRGLMYGDAVFDTTRTYGGTPWRLDDHLDRFRRSLRYVELDADVIVPEVREACLGCVERSGAEIADVGDVWISAVVTRGIMGGLDFDPQPRPTVVVMLRKINFAGFAHFYERGGVDLGVSVVRGHFQGPVDARVKATNRLAAVRGELKGRRLAADDTGEATRAWTVVFNDDGSIAEAHGANLALVADGKLVRPPRWEALEGVSLETVCELGRAIGLEVEERRIGVYDVINADETFICSTSFGVLPVIGLDGIALDAPRTVYAEILRRWVELVGFDFVTQARERAAAPELQAV